MSDLKIGSEQHNPFRLNREDSEFTKRAVIGYSTLAATLLAIASKDEFVSMSKAKKAIPVIGFGALVYGLVVLWECLFCFSLKNALESVEKRRQKSDNT
jgi:hypothetical protein